MEPLIITIFVISLITMSIILAKYLNILIVDILYIKNNEIEKEKQDKRIKKQEEEITFYLNLVNELKSKNKELEKELNKELYKEKKGDLPF